MYSYYAMNKTKRCQWSVEHPESREPEPQPKRMALASKGERIFLSLLEIMTPFFTHQEMNALGQANQAWKKKIIIDTKKYTYIDRTCSLLIAACLRNALYNSESRPMTSTRLVRLANIERSLQVATYSCSHIRYFQWSEREYGDIRDLKNLINTDCCCRNKRLNELLERFLFSKSDLSYAEQVVDTQIAGCGLTQLNRFTALHHLTLGKDGSKGITDSVLTHMVCLAGTLESLYIRSHWVTDVGLKILAQFAALKTLSLATFMTDDGLNVLSSLISLQTLSFEACEFTGAGLKALNQLTNLQTLIFCYCHEITAANIAQLAPLPALQDLSIKYCSKICVSPSSEGIRELESFTSLRSLTFIMHKPLEDHQLDLINKFTRLHNLNLSWNKSLRLTQLNGLTALRTLTLSLYDLLTLKTVVKLVDQYPNLQNLNISILDIDSDTEIQSKRLMKEIKLKITARRLHVIIRSLLFREEWKVHEDLVDDQISLDP